MVTLLMAKAELARARAARMVLFWTSVLESKQVKG